MNTPLSLSLDGEWEFFYSPQKFDPPISTLPPSKQFTGKMVTPGYWDDNYDLFDEEDFFGLTARFNPDYRKPHFPMARSLMPHASSSFLIGTGFYKKRFIAPETFSYAVIHVGPAMWGCSVFCNGNFAGKITGYSTGSRFILEEFILPGQENEIIIAVCNLHDDGGAYHRLDTTHDGMAFGSRPGQHRGLAAQGYQSERGGIGGGVSLKFTNHAEIVDYCISFADERPRWFVETRGNKAVLDWQMSFEGKIVDSGSQEISGKSVFYSDVPPQLWSDRNPKLCDIQLTLKTDNTICDKVSFKWGARKLTVEKMHFKLNNIPTFLRGVTEHCYFAETTNPHFDKDKYLRDLAVLREAGFNFIRCHTWCPPEPFFDACDELGFLVQFELPSVWTWEDAEYILKLTRRHASAVILCEGNEKIIDEVAIVRLQKLVALMKELAPGMLFNPQEAMRGIEYDFTPGRKIVEGALVHDKERLDRVRKFSDCIGCLGGEFSYFHDQFKNREIVEERLDVFDRPCLLHESGILGGYLDFSLEKRYEGTFIGTDLFKAAREHMTKRGVYQNAKLYYEKNSLFMSLCRKQLVENLRSLRNAAGFDYLGGIDTHWHLTGYPCGIFNEFYEEKYGETIDDVRLYCGESILVCTASNQRNFSAGNRFSENIEFVCYEAEGLKDAVLNWTMKKNDNSIVASGSQTTAEFRPGTITSAAIVEFDIPNWTCAAELLLETELSCNGKVWKNHWNFWIFPKANDNIPQNVKITPSLNDEIYSFLESGGRVILTGNFPAEMMPENFRSCTSGRALGHAGALLHQHPIWQKFPNNGNYDWQFKALMEGSASMVYDHEMPEFKPVFSLIPTFKMVKHKSMLSEFIVGKGRLIICGFTINGTNPAAMYMKEVLIDYLAGDDFVDAPSWSIDKLKAHALASRMGNTGQKMDEGGRPIKEE